MEADQENIKKNCILIIGECGAGKTWVMKQLIKEAPTKSGAKLKKFCFIETDQEIIIGKYTNSKFDGGDALSMAVITDLPSMLAYITKQKKIAVFEGDRFMNSRFITEANPVIIKIKDNGQAGRAYRDTSQTDGHLQRIKTRVANIEEHVLVSNSAEAHIKIKEIINQYHGHNN